MHSQIMENRTIMPFFLAIMVLGARNSAPAPAPILSPFPMPDVLAPTPAPVPAPAPAIGGIKGGYWPSWKANMHPPSLIPTSFFTHLFYAFITPDVTSYQLIITPTHKKWMSNFTLTLHKKCPTLKFMLSIGGGGSDPNIFSNMSSTCENRAKFIQSSINVAREYGFDGLDLDWEFPKKTQDRSNLALLLKEWHVAVIKESADSCRPRLLLSAAVYFASTFFLSDPPQAYPGIAIGQYLDFINPMCYDYRGSWNTSTTGAQSLLYDKFSNISTSYGISLWKSSGVPSNKIIMGMPMYGRSWKLRDQNLHGIGAPAVGIGPGHKGVMTYNNVLEFNLANNVTLVYDNETVSAYSYTKTTWIGYDDTKTTVNKIKFAKSQGLGGYFFWAVNFDDKNWTISRTASLAWDEE